MMMLWRRLAVAVAIAVVLAAVYGCCGFARWVQLNPAEAH